MSRVSVARMRNRSALLTAGASGWLLAASGALAQTEEPPAPTSTPTPGPAAPAPPSAEVETFPEYPDPPSFGLGRPTCAAACGPVQRHLHKAAQGDRSEYATIWIDEEALLDSERADCRFVTVLATSGVESAEWAHLNCPELRYDRKAFMEAETPGVAWFQLPPGDVTLHIQIEWIDYGDRINELEVSALGRGSSAGESRFRLQAGHAYLLQSSADSTAVIRLQDVTKALADGELRYTGIGANDGIEQAPYAPYTDGYGGFMLVNVADWMGFEFEQDGVTVSNDHLPVGSATLGGFVWLGAIGFGADFEFGLGGSVRSEAQGPTDPSLSEAAPDPVLTTLGLNGSFWLLPTSGTLPFWAYLRGGVGYWEFPHPSPDPFDDDPAIGDVTTPIGVGLGGMLGPLMFDAQYRRLLPLDVNVLSVGIGTAIDVRMRPSTIRSRTR